MYGFKPIGIAMDLVPEMPENMFKKAFFFNTGPNRGKESTGLSIGVARKRVTDTGKEGPFSLRALELIRL